MTHKLDEVIAMIDTLLSDTSIPRNIRKTLSEAKDRLLAKEETNVKVSAAIYMIGSVSEDINTPAHARTQIWTIMSALESLKSQ
jgi:uncharacterized protein (UPF0147 family)